MSKCVLIAGGGGFIGGHLAKRLLAEGDIVICVDIKPIENWFQVHTGAKNITADLSLKEECLKLVKGIDVVYNFACNMGGMGFIENHKALCMISVLINTHLLMASRDHEVSQYFYASSACVYPAHLQSTADVTGLKENSVYPAMPEDGYGWEKLFSERMCRHFYEDFGLNVRIARFHNVYGSHGSWNCGREKAPAAICRKVIEAVKNETFEIEVWGDGEQTRSFMYIDDCLEGVAKLMASDYREPINIGRAEMVSINDLVNTVSEIAGKSIQTYHKLDAPLGVRGRSSDNALIREILDWEPIISMKDGMNETYQWIKNEMKRGGATHE